MSALALWNRPDVPLDPLAPRQLKTRIVALRIADFCTVYPGSSSHFILQISFGGFPKELMKILRWLKASQFMPTDNYQEDKL